MSKYKYLLKSKKEISIFLGHIYCNLKKSNVYYYDREYCYFYSNCSVNRELQRRNSQLVYIHQRSAALIDQSGSLATTCFLFFGARIRYIYFFLIKDKKKHFSTPKKNFTGKAALYPVYIRFRGVTRSEGIYILYWGRMERGNHR